MSLFIQSANGLVSRVAQWVGAVPETTSISVSSINTTTDVLTVTTDPRSVISNGDFIGTSINGPFTVVLSSSATTITVSDPDDVWVGVSTPVTIVKLPTNMSLQIQSCIQMCELKMRTLELPALRTNPYDTVAPSKLITNAEGLAPIPGDMFKPVLFFQQTPNSEVTPGTPAASYGPWIIYDRVGDREIIRRRMIDQLYVRPFGVPRVIRASFSEVGPNYVFTPNPGEGCEILAYYYRTFPFLFSDTDDALNPVIQTNGVLASFPEGYIYGTLWAYYDKNKNLDEAQKWLDRFDASYGLIEDQNYKGKWTGGDRHLTSEFQPRDYRYNFK